MNEPYPPVVSIPDGLSDEAAAELLAFLYDLARVIENHYAGQLHRHYAPTDERQLPLWEDPPF